MVESARFGMTRGNGDPAVPLPGLTCVVFSGTRPPPAADGSPS
jgi:hypothetical protein